MNNSPEQRGATLPTAENGGEWPGSYPHREFPNGILAKYAMGLTPESVKDNDRDYIKGWNRALVLAEILIEEMNQAEQEIRKPALE